MAGIAKERHPAYRPALERRTVKQPPDECFLYGVEHARHVLVPAREGSTGFIDITAVGPGLLRPRILFNKCNEIDIAHAGDEIPDEMFTRPHCNLVHNFEIEMLERFGGHQPAIGRAAGEPWWCYTE